MVTVHLRASIDAQIIRTILNVFHTGADFTLEQLWKVPTEFLDPGADLVQENSKYGVPTECDDGKDARSLRLCTLQSDIDIFPTPLGTTILCF